MLKNAKWVRCGKEEVPIIRKSFTASQFEKAEIAICGLGFFELYINGKKVSDDLFVPARSEYEKRNYVEKFDVSHRIYYMNYDLDGYITEGENVIGVMLANGWYNEWEWMPAGDTHFDLPKLCFSIKLTHTDGSIEEIISDEKMKYSTGYITYSNIFYGEKQDLRLLDESWKKSGFDDSEWNAVEIIKNTESILVKQNCPADRVIRKIKPVLLSKTGETAIYDLKENITGWAKIKVKGTSGEKVTVRYAEEIYSDGSLNFETAGWEGQIQTEEFILNGAEMICEPVFTFHGFRYFEVTGNAEVIEGVVVHTDVDVKATFECDNDVLNWFFDAYIRTQLANMHWGTPCDCPHRERLAYTGDGQLCSDAAMLFLESRDFYHKWIYDIYDCQDVNTGHVHYTAPSYGGIGGGPGGWGCAIVMVPYFFWKHFGETDVLEAGYDKMCKWVEYMKSRSENGLVVREDGKWFLGDWCTPDEVILPPPYVNTYFLVKALGYMKEIAAEIGREFIYDDLVISSINDIKREYYNEETNSYAESVQGADLFALDIGIGNREMLERAVKYYEELESFDTGIFGTYLLIKLLFENGFEDTAFKLLVSEKPNTFGLMKKNNATTLWELWDGNIYGKLYNSHSHPMFGACANQLFYGLLGIKTLDKTLLIKPQLPEKINYAKGSVKTVRGDFAVEYTRKGEKIEAVIDIACNEAVYFRYDDKEILLSNGKNCFEF